MLWFGEDWKNGYDATDQQPVPIGGQCAYCDETIIASDHGVIVPSINQTDLRHVPLHGECFVRQIVGGINHQRGKCFCCGGNSEPDPATLTKRQAAKLAVAYFYIMQSVKSR